MLFGDSYIKKAEISECKNYRYSLTRIWDETKPKVLFIMLNPSTADHEIDDPTIKRCIRFANSWNFGGLYVGNLLPYRATNPKELLSAENPMGFLNNIYLANLGAKSDLVVCAWGNAPILEILKKKFDFFSAFQKIDKELHCIQVSTNGTPKHPLYLKGDSTPKIMEKLEFLNRN